MMSSKPYPIVLTGLHKVRCVVVGGGPVAERKVEALLDCAAQVAVISPTLTDQLRAWAEARRLRYIDRPFRPDDLRDTALVIAATDDPAVNAEVAQEAHRAGLLVNVVDDPDAGNFNTVATVRRGDLTLAVSTGGASPAVAALIRRRLEASFGPEYGELLALLGGLRRDVARRLPPHVRRRVWQKLASEQVLGWLRAGQQERVWAYAEELIGQACNEVHSDAAGGR